MGRIELEELKGVSPFRKVAMGTWKTAKDPSVYGLVEIDMQPVLDLLPDFCKKHNVKITPAHLVGKAVAHVMGQRPEINSMIRGSKIYLRKDVDIFYQVNIPGKGGEKVKKASLSGAVVRDCNNLTTLEIAKTLASKAGEVRTGKDKEMAKNMEIFKIMPWWFVKYYLDLGSFLIYGLNWNWSFLGLPKDPFGSVMITNVGSLGIDCAWAPLCAYTRVPLLLTLGRLHKKPWVVDDKVVVKPVLPVAVTFDHRVIDGVHAAHMAAEFKKCFANPEELLLKI